MVSSPKLKNINGTFLASSFPRKMAESASSQISTSWTSWLWESLSHYQNTGYPSSRNKRHSLHKDQFINDVLLLWTLQAQWKISVLSTEENNHAYNRLAMGVKISPDVAQRFIMSNMLQGIPNCSCYIDDLGIWTNGIFDDHLNIELTLSFPDSILLTTWNATLSSVSGLLKKLTSLDFGWLYRE